jgi:hypothetical protein
VFPCSSPLFLAAGIAHSLLDTCSPTRPSLQLYISEPCQMLGHPLSIFMSRHLLNFLHSPLQLVLYSAQSPGHSCVRRCLVPLPFFSNILFHCHPFVITRNLITRPALSVTS